MERILDITIPLGDHVPVWPGSEGFQVRSAMSMESGDAANVTVIQCDVHTGTHIDAPRHFIPSGKATEDIPLDTLIGPAYVAHFPGLPRVTAGDLERAAVPPDAARLLLHTDNSDRIGSAVFHEGYSYLTHDAASWIASRGFRLLGFDYLSIERYGASPRAHLALLQADVVILEGISLRDVTDGWYELICLPLRLVGREAAPVRAILRHPGGSA